MNTLLFGFSPEKFSDACRTQIREIVPNMELVVTRDRAEIERVLADIEIAVCGFPHDLITQAPQLRWFQLWSAGADWLIKRPEVAECAVVITTTSGIHAIPISEHIFAYLLALARSFQYAIRRQTQHQWKDAGQPPVFELTGKTMLIVGVGAIGLRTAEIARAFGMRVLGVRRNPSAPAPVVEAMFGPEQLCEALPQADVVVLTTPLTPETHHSIGEREFRAMKPTAYLVNIGRGATVDQAALIRALQENWIAGAGLDVFEPEPLPEDSPLWDMENVIITGHYAGHNPYYDDRAMEVFLTNLRRYVADQPLLNVVDKRLGY